MAVQLTTPCGSRGLLATPKGVPGSAFRVSPSTKRSFAVKAIQAEKVRALDIYVWDLYIVKEFDYFILEEK